MANDEKQKRVNELRNERLRLRKKRRRIKVAMTFIFFMILIVAGIWGGITMMHKIEENSPENNTINVTKPSMILSADFDIQTPPKEVTLTVIGDVMMHEWQIERSYDKETDSFDVSDSFVYVEKYLSHADYTIANLETTLPGRNNGAMKDVLGYSGYPMFAAPECLADTLQDIGIDFLQTANNHSLDSWEDGIYATIDYLDSIGFEHTGTFKTKEDNDKQCIIEINGITFGFVAYTYGTNGLPVPSERPWCINTLETYRDDKLEEMYQKVRDLDAAGVDFVCPLIHFGTEYTEVPDSWQEMVVDGLFDAGADVIFGGHPHVVEPIDVRTITNPDGSTRTGYVVYSYGNFISSQRYDGVNKDLGMITDFTFKKEYVDNEAVNSVTDIKVYPTYVYWTDSTIGVVPVLEAYNNQDAFSFLSDYDWQRINYAKEHVIEVVTAKGSFDYNQEGDYFTITPK
ncbi:MAG: CapA family protein [Lachnospiraceae bacterium]|nr:CapA family protein [Lachnospiraceae bacterium]